MLDFQKIIFYSIISISSILSVISLVESQLLSIYIKKIIEMKILRENSEKGLLALVSFLPYIVFFIYFNVILKIISVNQNKEKIKLKYTKLLLLFNAMSLFSSILGMSCFYTLRFGIIIGVSVCINVVLSMLQFDVAVAFFDYCILYSIFLMFCFINFKNFHVYYFRCVDFIKSLKVIK